MALRLTRCHASRNSRNQGVPPWLAMQVPSVANCVVCQVEKLYFDARRCNVKSGCAFGVDWDIVHLVDAVAECLARRRFIALQ
jgi:hypothetical protein